MPPGSIPAHFKICAGSVAAGEATGSPISISILMLTCRGSYRIRSSPEYVTDMRSCNGESRELSNNNGGRPDAAEMANSEKGLDWDRDAAAPQYFIYHFISYLL